MAPYETRKDLDSHVHVPVITFVQYPALIDSPPPSSLSSNVAALTVVFRKMNIEDDPTVRTLRRTLGTVSDETERIRIDQRLSKALVEKDTFVHKGMRDFLRTAEELSNDIGPWGADWYIASVIKRALKKGIESLRELLPNSRPEETEYFAKLLRSVRVNEVSNSPDAVDKGCSKKTKKFIDCLLAEKKSWMDGGKKFSGLVFVTRRDGALALTSLLSNHPRAKDHFSVGTLLGSSESSKRNTFIDISRSMLPQSHTVVLSDFRDGVKNLVVATSVAEEGLDIPNCGTVVRWDRPSNVVSWVQSRGRARHKESTFILMLEEDSNTERQISNWQYKEEEMKRRYQEEHSRPQRSEDDAETRFATDTLDLVFTSPSTGYVHILHCLF